MKKKIIKENIGTFNEVIQSDTLNELLDILHDLRDSWLNKYTELFCDFELDEWNEGCAFNLFGERFESDEEFEKRKKRSEIAKKAAKKRVYKQKETKKEKELKLLAKLQKKYADYKE